MGLIQPATWRSMSAGLFSPSRMRLFWALMSLLRASSPRTACLRPDSPRPMRGWRRCAGYWPGSRSSNHRAARYRHPCARRAGSRRAPAATPRPCWGQYAAHPVRGPGVIEDRLALLVTGDGVGDDGRVGALAVSHRVAQPVGIEVMFDHLLAAPARVATGQVGLAVAVGIEELGELGVLELVDALDAVLFGGFLVDQVALQRTSE